MVFWEYLQVCDPIFTLNTDEVKLIYLYLGRTRLSPPQPGVDERVRYGQF